MRITYLVIEQTFEQYFHDVWHYWNAVGLAHGTQRL